MTLPSFHQCLRRPLVSNICSWLSFSVQYFEFLTKDHSFGRLSRISLLSWIAAHQILASFQLLMCCTPDSPSSWQYLCLVWLICLFCSQTPWICPKIITEFGEWLCTIFPVISVSKKNSPKWSQYLSPNLVIHKTHHQIWWKKLHFFNLFLFLKKNHQNGHNICHQIWWKNRTFLIYFRFLKKNHWNSHDNCHQIWWFTKPITKFGEENRTFLITIHPSGPSSLGGWGS